MIQRMRRKDMFEAKVEKWKTFTSLVRFFGSMIMTIDICLKIYYCVRSRFTNHYVKDVYIAFLFLRPVGLIILIFYNFCIEFGKLQSFNSKQNDYAELMKIKREKKKKKKGKGEQEEQKEGGDNDAQPDEKNKESNTEVVKSADPADIIDDVERATQQKRMLKTLIYRHLALLSISYTGFIRILAGSEQLQGLLLFSHIFEVVCSSAPLYALQIFNNDTLNKFTNPLDLMNLIFFALSLFDLLFQLIANQIWKQDSQYTLLSQQRIGLSKEKTGEADHSDEIDCSVSEDSSEDSDGVWSKAEENQVIPIGRGFTRAELMYFKDDFKKEQAIFLKREEMNNHEFGFMWFVSLLFFASLLVIGNFVFDVEKCGINLYENQGYCYDCLQTLGDKCQLCTKFGECDECIPGFYLGEV